VGCGKVLLNLFLVLYPSLDILLSLNWRFPLINPSLLLTSQSKVDPKRWRGLVKNIEGKPKYWGGQKMVITDESI